MTVVLLGCIKIYSYTMPRFASFVRVREDMPAR